MRLRMKPCSVAGCSETGRVRCSICKVWYCSLQCQQQDWPAHRRFCVKPPPLEWPSGPAPLRNSITRTGPMEGGGKEKSLEEEKVTLEIPNFEYKEAVICSEMAVKNPEKNKRYEILPVEYFESPSEFSVRLEVEVSCVNTEYFIIKLINLRMKTVKTCWV